MSRNSLVDTDEGKRVEGMRQRRRVRHYDGWVKPLVISTASSLPW
jgi:hypothetical protein